MRFSLLLALALASSGVVAASAADLRIPLSKRRPPVTVNVQHCTPPCAPLKVDTPIGKGAMQ